MDRRTFLLAAIFMTASYGQELIKDTGEGFELEWTDAEVEICSLSYGVDVSYCSSFKAGDKLVIPDLENCVAWAAQDRSPYDFETLCNDFRYGCFAIKYSRDNKSKLDGEQVTACAESYDRFLSGYTTDVKSGEYKPKEASKSTEAPAVTLAEGGEEKTEGGEEKAEGGEEKTEGGEEKAEGGEEKTEGGEEKAEGGEEKAEGGEEKTE